MLDARIEEALERLYLAENERLDYPADAETASALKDAAATQLVDADGDQWRLTDSGHHAGRNVVRRHRLAERLLQDVLLADASHLNEDACRFEHILVHGLDDKICALLGHPNTCPHGKPIPVGECCRQAETEVIPEVSSLADAKPGASGTVAYLTSREDRKVQKLMAMGILPGETLSVIRRFPSYVFQVGFSQFTIDKALAEDIYVHWAGADPEHADRPHTA